jgi:hypothetical protein
MALERVLARDFMLVVEIREADRGARAGSASPRGRFSANCKRAFYYRNARTFRLEKQAVIAMLHNRPLRHRVPTGD